LDFIKKLNPFRFGQCQQIQRASLLADRPDVLYERLWSRIKRAMYYSVLNRFVGCCITNPAMISMDMCRSV